MNIQLSKREHNILLHLLTTTSTTTTKELSDVFNISVRTIKYDIDNIRFWLANRQVELSSKRGKGVWIEIPDSKRLELKNEIFRLEKVDLSIDQVKRLHKLVFELLSHKEYLTSETLSQQLQVTKNTILSDVDRAETLLSEYRLTLLRINGKGFMIQGEESDSRLLLEKIIQEEISDYDIYNIMNQLVKGQQTSKKMNIYIGLNTEFQEIYEKTLTYMTKMVNSDLFEKLNYSDVLSITIRTAISVSRLLIRNTIGTYQLLPDQNGLTVQQDLPFLLVQAVYNEYGLPLLEDEFSYIYSDVLNDRDTSDISKISENIIESVSQTLDFPFTKDTVLFTNLFAHLSLRLSRKHLFINEYNPFVVDIKANYSDLYQAIQDVSKREINGGTLIVNESFVAYIALHFLVSIEKYRSRDSVRVVYVCSTGLGVTSLLQQTIRDELTNVEVISFASILNIHDEIAKGNPDLLISIFPIEDVNIPWIKVNPIPSQTDIKRIQDQVDRMISSNEQSFGNYKIKPRNKIQSNQTVEDESRELIVKGYIVYESLKEVLADVLEESLLDSFLLHVLLMVHRIQYNAQYVNEDLNYREIINQNKATVMSIEEVFSKNELAINHSEIIALLQYQKGSET